MKRLLFVIPYLNEGGAQRALSNIMRNLPEDLEADVLVNSANTRKYPIKGNILSLHIDEEAKTSSLLFQIKAFRKRVSVLKELKSQNKYAACISFIDSANITNIISSRLLKGNHNKTIISVRTSLRESAKRQAQYKYIVRPLAKLMYRKADAVVAVSEELRRELIEDLNLKADRVVTITNGFNVEELRQLSKESIDDSIQKVLSGKKEIFTAGRLNFAKNQWHLIRAFSYIKKSFPDTVLVLAGTGELDGYLHELADGLGLREDVVFLGFEKNVYRYLLRSDVFVLPSAFEGFPNALGEALCVGVPCVATDFKTGARELLAPELLFDGSEIDAATECKYGILVPNCSGIRYGADDPLEKSEKELADAIIRIISDNGISEKYKHMSVERSKDLDIKCAVKKWIEVIEG